MKILKFGGTSVGKPERMHEVARLIRGEGMRIVVLSALSGTTNALVEIAECLYKKDKEGAKAKIVALQKHYDTFIQSLYSSDAAREKARNMLNEHFKYLTAFTEDSFTLFEERAVLAQGELMSTAMFHLYMEEKGEESVLLPALDFMRIDENEEPDMAYITEHLAKQLKAHAGKKMFITQGYICRNAFGEIDNLKRGGSDYTASLVGAAADAEEIQIWTDIDGMHNNDPRIVEDTFPVAAMSFEEAAELAYFGAKILHPLSVRPAKDKNIPVKLLNTMEPSARGTTISNETGGATIKAVAAKDGITAIKIKSGRMLLAYGFLRKVFEIFERYKTPIDMITTSEVAVSLTIDNVKHLDEIIKELETFAFVEVDGDMTIVCVVGDLIVEKEGVVSKIFSSISDIPLRMISYGGSKNNISVLVPTDQKNRALNALNVIFEEYRVPQAQ
ncbi:MAG: aspartate kinase [Flavobacteriales bacterium]|nr:aspartate kinase [Flavobacteriales bacterium]